MSNLNINREVVEAEVAIKVQVYKDCNAANSGPEIPWDHKAIQQIIQEAVEKVIQRRIAKIMANP